MGIHGMAGGRWGGKGVMTYSLLAGQWFGNLGGLPKGRGFWSGSGKQNGISAVACGEGREEVAKYFHEQAQRDVGRLVGD